MGDEKVKKIKKNLCLNACCDDVITKPINVKNLLLLIEKYVK